MEYTVKEYKGKNYTAIIRKPILTAEERRKREDACKKALVEYAKEVGFWNKSAKPV